MSKALVVILFCGWTVLADDRPTPQKPPAPPTLNDVDAHPTGDAASYVARARPLLSEGQTTHAIIQLNTALKLSPRMPAAMYWRGVALRRLGVFDEALEHIEAGLRGGVRDPDADAIRASILYRLGRLDEALAIREREVQANPQDVEERQYRAEVYAAMGKSKELARDLDFIYTRAPERRAGTEALIKRIVTSREAREAAAKVADANEAYAAGNHLFWERKYGQAAEWYARAAVIKPDHVDALCGAAKCSELTANAFGHAWFAVRAVRLDPKNAEARTLRGWAWRNLRAFDLAEGEFNAAIALDPAYAPARLGRAKLLYECDLNRTREAQLDFDKAVELAPKDPDTWMARAIFLLEYAPAFISTQGLPAERAFNPPWYDFSKAIELDPRRTKAYVYRGITLAAWGKAAAAKADLTKAFELEPWDAKANLQFAKNTLADMRIATRAGRQLMEDLASGAQGPLPVPDGGDGGAAARAKWARDTAVDNASRAGDNAAADRIRRDEATWRDKSRYGG
jgi:tetratricopeptide (TPR) repeat protein